MKTFTCYVGLLRDGLIDRVRFLPDLRPAIENAFRSGSSGPAGPDFTVKLNFARYKRYRIPKKQMTNTLHLQRAAGKILGPQPKSAQLKELAILYSDEFGPRKDLFGLMFDDGFLGNPQQRHIPRQACAVFLKPIYQARSANQIKDEVFFTSVHEIGHMFNLWHTSHPASFMSSSPISKPLPPNFHEFHAAHSGYLARCTHSKYVHPGGAKFGDRNGHGPSDGTNFNDPAHSPGVSLRISTQDVFSYFEPVELDISLTNVSKSKLITVPDQMDPGYSTFDIWIKTPRGEVFRYIPTKRFCSNPGTITLKPGESFSRDISVFGQSGGYTFTEEGVYSITCVFQTDAKTNLHSNTLEVEVRHRANARVSEVLLDTSIARHAYYRQGAPNKSQTEALKSISTKRLTKNYPSIWNLHYSFGRGIANRVLSRESRSLKRDTTLALEYLNNCIVNIDEDTNRFRKVSDVIETLTSR